MPDDFSAEDEFRDACQAPCETCGPLAVWVPALGPPDIVTRLRVMRALVSSGMHEEYVTGRAPSGQPYRPWSSLRDDQVCDGLVANGRAPGLDDLDSGMTIRCRACRRTFRQQWTPERGNESWTVTADDRVPRVPQV